VTLRHAVLGAGGVGGLLAAALARSGAPVVLLLRPSSLARYDGRLRVESAALGDFEVAVPAVASLDREIDVLWIATKATGLAEAIALAPAGRVGETPVVPLLNGIDHVALLRAVYARVVPAAIRVESERGADGRIRQTSALLRVELADGETLAAELRAAGIACSVREDERSLLWDKLAFLGPVALATTALDAPLGAVRGDERFRRSLDEALAVARAEGARIDEQALRALVESVPAAMRSSMQKDVAAGREPELDAIAGPILRGGERHGIDVAATSALASLVAARP
jgi:2-dehydropantoate 2-reductase